MKKSKENLHGPKAIGSTSHKRMAGYYLYSTNWRVWWMRISGDGPRNVHFNILSRWFSSTLSSVSTAINCSVDAEQFKPLQQTFHEAFHALDSALAADLIGICSFAGCGWLVWPPIHIMVGSRSQGRLDASAEKLHELGQKKKPLLSSGELPLELEIGKLSDLRFCIRQELIFSALWG